MKRSMRWAQLLVAVDLCLLLCGVGATVAVAESYVQAQGGLGFPARFHHFTGDYYGKQLFSTSDLAMTSGAAYGAKVGYFFASTPWLGLEGSYLHTAPTFPGQDYWYIQHNPTGRLTRGEHEPSMRVTVDSVGMNLVLRYPGETWQPYAAVGPALYWGNYGGDPSLTHVGYAAEGGLRVRVWRGLFVSASYIYQNARLVMRESTGPNQSINGFSALYQNHLALAGIGWAF